MLSMIDTPKHGYVIQDVLSGGFENCDLFCLKCVLSNFLKLWSFKHDQTVFIKNNFKLMQTLLGKL